ncbi:universal stress protein [Thermodesulfobacteriota bacterium]
MFKNILVPTDLSEKSAGALEIAANIALQYQACVYLLHVIEVIADASFDEFKDFYMRLEKKAQRAMDALTAPYKDRSVDLRPSTVYGTRAGEILNFATSHDIDLIVLNSHRIVPGDSIQGWGTISYKVGILAQCPVLLVK